VAGPEATLRSLMGSRPPLAAERPFPYDAAPLRNACPPLQPHKGLCKLLNSILNLRMPSASTPPPPAAPAIASVAILAALKGIL